MKINQIGVWTTRLAFVIGGITAGLMDKESLMNGLCTCAILSFIFLSTDDNE
jgi:hypothetical protein